MTLRIHPVSRSPFPRASFLLAILVALAAGACRRGGDALPAERRLPLTDSVAEGATLSIDSLGRAWIGEPGRMTALDTAGRVAARLPVPGEAAPRLLWSRGGRVMARAGDRVMLLDPAVAKVAATRRSAAPVARDPRGRWVYTATRIGGVLGLEPERLQPRWGWPDAGARATAIAVSPLADRVYVALGGTGDDGDQAVLQERDALTGRLLSTMALDAPLDALEASRDGALFGLARERVVKLRPGAEGVAREWIVASGLDEVEGLRLSPAGGRLAVVARGGVRVLDASSGEVVRRTSEAPLDVAYDGEGRLWMLFPREIRILR